MLPSQGSAHMSREVAQDTRSVCRLSERRFHAVGYKGECFNEVYPFSIPELGEKGD